MIYCIHHFLTMAGYSACGVLLGSFMMRYGNATEFDLGLVFMIQPFTIIARPFICARADRYQAHKQMLCFCLLLNALAYLPFIIIPFLVEIPQLNDYLKPRVRFWILVCSHTVGSFSFCGARSLGDAMTVNHAKRIGSDYTSFRKYGAISYGTFGYLLGHINQGWTLPDFVPTNIVYVGCILNLTVLIYLWPDEFFVMSKFEENCKQVDNIYPNGKEILAHMGSKLKRTICFCHLSSSPSSSLQSVPTTTNTKAVITYYGKDGSRDNCSDYTRTKHQTNDGCLSTGTGSTATIANKKEMLSTRQQISIFLLLTKRDIRIPLFLLFLVYGGMVGYAPINFVYTYMHEFCDDGKVCDASYLAGLVMIVYCVVETGAYMIISANRSRLNPLYALELTLVCLIVHYYFYGFLLPHLSPYFFLVESLHGIEFAISLWTSIELGYRFAGQVELLIPELMQKGVISERDDQQAIKVSLMATMSAFFTLVYDGLGSMIGAFMYGLVTDQYNFSVTWILIGTLSSVGLVLVLATVLIGKCFHIEPQILKYKKNSISQVN